MNICSSYEPESRVIEIINPKKTIIVIGCIYRHPSMDLNEFNNIYLSKPLDFILKENETEFLLGDFNSNLLKYEKYDPAIEFLDSFSSNMFLLYILHPTRIHGQSRILIDNIDFQSIE